MLISCMERNCSFHTAQEAEGRENKDEYMYMIKFLIKS